MAVDMFIKIDDIKGESLDSKHKDEISVLAWSWGMTQSGSAHISAGGGTGKVNVQDISFTKYIDKSSATLMTNCAIGKHMKVADLVVRKAGEKPLEYLKIHLEDILISSISTGGSGGEDRLTENITLNFGRYKVEYTPQKADGTGEAAQHSGYDIQKNIQL